MKHWLQIRLDECCEIVSGATPDTTVQTFWNGEIFWATPKDLSNLIGAYISDTPRKLSAAGLKSCSASILPKNSVLFSSRAPIGHVAVNAVPMATNQGFKSFIPNVELIDAKFLFWWLKTNKDYFESLGNGATFKEVSKAVVSKVQIPLPYRNGKPDLDEQTRIGAILDKADSIRRKRQDAIRLTDDFLRSVFLDMFGDPALNNKGFPSGTIRDLVAAVNYGTSQKAHLTDGKYVVLRMNNITSAGGWNFADLKYVDLEEHSAHKYLVHKGQMLFNRTNSKELVGKTAVYREEKPIAFAGYLVRAIANANADAEYISAYLNSAHGKTVLRGMCKSIVGMANINAQELLSIPISIPPEALQKQFGNIVRNVYSKSHTHRLASQTASDLFSSLQQHAFAGDL